MCDQHLEKILRKLDMEQNKVHLDEEKKIGSRGRKGGSEI